MKHLNGLFYKHDWLIAIPLILVIVSSSKYCDWDWFSVGYFGGILIWVIALNVIIIVGLFKTIGLWKKLLVIPVKTCLATISLLLAM